jgi:hypothetical protein
MRYLYLDSLHTHSDRLGTVYLRKIHHHLFYPTFPGQLRFKNFGLCLFV